MSQGPFIHDFFQDGRLDVLAEIRELQFDGQWTKEVRAYWIKQSVADYQRSKHTHPHVPQGSSYFADRIAALRSTITTHYSTFNAEFHGKMALLPFPGKKKVLCLECGDESTWKCHPDGSFHLVMSLCDRCKQERVRDAVVSICRQYGHEDKFLSLPVTLSDKLVVKEKPDLGFVLAPVTAITGLGLLDLMVHAPTISFFFQIWFILGLTIQDKDIWQAFCDWIESEP